MFTGIVQGIGEIIAVQDKEGFRQYQVKLPEPLSNKLSLGASIANDGCCLTVSAIKDTIASFDLMDETLARTTLGQKQVGDKLNIERAVQLGDEIGGHLMSGHIACRGKIIHISASTYNYQLTIEIPKAFSRYILYKGFVGVDGISLTVGVVTDTMFKLHLIPETRDRTTLGGKKEGDEVNIEIDPQTQTIVDKIYQVMTDRALVK